MTSEDLLAQIKASLSGLIAGQTQGRRPQTGPGPESDRQAYLYSLLGGRPCSIQTSHSSRGYWTHAVCHWPARLHTEGILRVLSIGGGADHYIQNDVKSITESIVSHVEYTLARNRYSFNTLEAYQAQPSVCGTGSSSPGTTPSSTSSELTAPGFPGGC